MMKTNRLSQGRLQVRHEKNPENEGKRNMSLTLSNDKNIKKLMVLGLITLKNICMNLMK